MNPGFSSGQAPDGKKTSRFVTMLFSDIVGSTKLKRSLRENEAIERIVEHHTLFRDLLGQFADAEEVSTAGDSFFLLFARPADAVRFALLVQAALRARGGEGPPVLDRIGIHEGEIWQTNDAAADGNRDLLGIQIDTCARIASLGSADQILMTRQVFDRARNDLLQDQVSGLRPLEWKYHGPYLMKGLDEPLEICEVGELGRAALSPPRDCEKGRRVAAVADEAELGWRPAIGGEVPGTPWVLDRKLGEGGFGEVWLGLRPGTSERIVLKFCFDAAKARTLKREATLFRVLQSRMGHIPHTVPIEAVNFDAPPYYLAFQYVEAVSLKEWLSMHPEAPFAARLEIAVQVAEALGAAHVAGVIHRDIKPSNVLIGGDERGNICAYLTDFGIGQVTTAELLSGITQLGFTSTSPNEHRWGTSMYMAPELFAGRPASTRSDVYALGVMIFQLLQGDFRTPVPDDWRERIADPLIREDLARCLAPEPKDRFASADELARNLGTLQPRHEAKAKEQSAKVRSERRKYVWRIAWTTMIEAPLIATLIASAIRAIDSDDGGYYAYYFASLIPLYLLLVALVAMYFGLSAGTNVIFRHRESLPVIPVPAPARTVFRLGVRALAITAVAGFLFTYIGTRALEIEGLFFVHFAVIVLVAMAAAPFAMCLGTFNLSREAAARVMVAIMLPQVVLGGSLLRQGYTRDPSLKHAWNREPHLFQPQPAGLLSRIVLPGFSRFFPVGYGWEALVCGHAYANPLSSRQKELSAQIAMIAQRSNPSEAELRRLEDLKETLALLSGLEAASKAEVERRLRRVDAVIDGKSLDTASLKSRTGGVKAARLYTNAVIEQMAFEANAEQSGQNREDRSPVFLNTIFGEYARYFHLTLTKLSFDLVFLLAYSLAGFSLLYLRLRREAKRASSAGARPGEAST